MDIKDPIHQTLEIDEREIPVLDSPAFQRLRLIKQLGFAEFAFPGATHNRYLHSLGVLHLSGLAFESIFRDYKFSNQDVRKRLKQTLRLGALLHDIGHGPLSHTTEEVMPLIKDLKIGAYQNRVYSFDENQKASHEDYSIKLVTDSSLTKILRRQFPDIDPYHIACLIDKSLSSKDDFFIDGGLDFRNILSQIVSSELDVDRMDYLERDAYFCGTSYGKFERSWLLSSLSYHVKEGKVYLALDRRALYTFDDFLLSRHHMYLMVYFHHKSIIYEEMLTRYLTSKDCKYFLPTDIEDYGKFNDYSLYEHLAQVDNPWAKQINERRPYKMLFELHSVEETKRPEEMKRALMNEGVDVILSSSRARLSKYHSPNPIEKSLAIYVVDHLDLRESPIPIEQCTEIFLKYEETRRIERLYVSPENYIKSRKVLVDQKL
jgi:HD superfamily phosphohydrolase